VPTRVGLLTLTRKPDAKRDVVRSAALSAYLGHLAGVLAAQ